MAARPDLPLTVPVPQATKRDAGAAAPADHPSFPENHMAESPSFKSLYDLLDDLTTYGECRFDPDLHTGPDSFMIEPAAERMVREDVAREVCEGCPVWDVCLDYALRLPSLPKGGIWAGYTANEIAALKRQAREQETAA
jgi:WhiB family redox-sensing transcriptional regulator